MHIKPSRAYRVFTIFNHVFMVLVMFLCLFPLVHLLALSFSASWAASAKLVKLWPVAFTWSSYEYVMQKPEFVSSLLVSVKRVAIGVPLNILMIILAAYPLSKEKSELRARNIYAWFFIITMLFSGGLIPTYMLIRSLRMIDTIWALVLPGAVSVYNMLLLMNFLRQLPKEIEESAFLDGAGHLTNLWHIQLPLSLPALATVVMFCTVGHWNAWFDGLIYMNRPEHYPLQSYLQTVVTTIDQRMTNMTTRDIELLKVISNRTTKAAQIFLAALPILAVYPFLQKYFMTGLVLGSVKG